MNGLWWMLPSLIVLVWLSLEWMRRQLSPRSAEYVAPHRVLAEPDIGAAAFDEAAAGVHALVADGYPYRAKPYAHAADAVAAFLWQMDRRAPHSLAHFHTLAAIRVYVLRDDWNAAARAREGWTDASRSACAESAWRCMTQPQWTSLVDAGLASNDDNVFHTAAQAADALGRNCAALHWQRLIDKPEAPQRWFKCACDADAERTTALVALAGRVLPLARIAAQADDDGSSAVVLAPESLQHDDAAYAQLVVLELVLELLTRFPDMGRDVVLAGFNSPLARSRQLALIAFLRRPRLHHDGEVVAALQRAANAEPGKSIEQHFRIAIADLDRAALPG